MTDFLVLLKRKNTLLEFKPATIQFRASYSTIITNLVSKIKLTPYS